MWHSELREKGANAVEMTNKRCPTDSAKSVLPIVKQYLLRMLNYTLLALLKTLLDKVSPLEQKLTIKDQQTLG
ncbi:hypothetical protein Q4519_07690 [Motilimonas sp. 1_MG-2023]|uniref:hypothetical protein n=1 Tax=Motilimonas sp. 1_MG-2023 TaxID=3062672 RepID=UPI0026E1BCE3|nr:hypothetical protein [Motilimonas sp. 1_MG-2023]MDO6525563.1 hypothetical protein [Motilimonas sp. 1_MG-2023]